MFQLFDQDGSGGVTLSEFTAVLDELVNELDEYNRGTLKERHCVDLLERNAHVADMD
jgi:hypothetical protein